MGYIRLRRRQFWSAGASEARPRFGSLGEVIRHSQSAVAAALYRRTPNVTRVAYLRTPPVKQSATRERVALRLSTPFHKYGHVCDEGFWAQTRRERRAYPSGVRSEQRRRGQKERRPEGCVVFMKRGTKPCDVSSTALPRLPRS